MRSQMPSLEDCSRRCAAAAFNVLLVGRIQDEAGVADPCIDSSDRAVAAAGAVVDEVTDHEAVDQLPVERHVHAVGEQQGLVRRELQPLRGPLACNRGDSASSGAPSDGARRRHSDPLLLRAQAHAPAPGQRGAGAWVP